MPSDGRAKGNDDDDDDDDDRNRTGNEDNTREGSEERREEEEAFGIAIKVVSELDLVKQLSSLKFLARGGYNYVWRVTYILEPTSEHATRGFEVKDFVLRIARKESPLQPYRLLNEVACLQYLAAKVPSILAPRVYAWNDGASPGSGPAFLVEDLIEGRRLSIIWPQLSESQKLTIIREIANTLADLGETRFGMIGGLTLGMTAGPTIEAAKLFNGRARYHSPQCYDIGPYTTSKAYILACYDREIYYYNHIPASEILEDVFTDIPVLAFVEQLQRERDTLATQTPSVFAQIEAEPRVLVHEDFHAGNMLVHDGHLAGVVDWEFSGTYPLSELVGPIAILQISGLADERDDMSEQEEGRWHARYLEELERIVKEREWKDEDVSTLIGGGHHMLHKARSIMFPEERVEAIEENE